MNEKKWRNAIMAGAMMAAALLKKDPIRDIHAALDYYFEN